MIRPAIGFTFSVKALAGVLPVTVAYSKGDSSNAPKKLML